MQKIRYSFTEAACSISGVLDSVASRSDKLNNSEEIFGRDESMPTNVVGGKQQRVSKLNLRHPAVSAPLTHDA